MKKICLLSCSSLLVFSACQNPDELATTEQVTTELQVEQLDESVNDYQADSVDNSLLIEREKITCIT